MDYFKQNVLTLIAIGVISFDIANAADEKKLNKKDSDNIFGNGEETTQSCKKSLYDYGYKGNWKEDSNFSGTYSYLTSVMSYQEFILDVELQLAQEVKKNMIDEFCSCKILLYSDGFNGWLNTEKYSFYEIPEANWYYCSSEALVNGFLRFNRDVIEQLKEKILGEELAEYKLSRKKFGEHYSLADSYCMHKFKNVDFQEILQKNNNYGMNTASQCKSSLISNKYTGDLHEDPYVVPDDKEKFKPYQDFLKFIRITKGELVGKIMPTKYKISNTINEYCGCVEPLQGDGFQGKEYDINFDPKVKNSDENLMQDYKTFLRTKYNVTSDKTVAKKGLMNCFQFIFYLCGKYDKENDILEYCTHRYLFDKHTKLDA